MGLPALDPGLPTPTETAVIAVIPEAEGIVGQHRLRFDQAASWGVPAHVTVLYPFLHPKAIETGVVAALGAVAASVPVFDCVFPRTGWFARDVLWLAPDPAEPFHRLTASVWAAFPDHPPYGGIYDEVIPHLTVGEARFGTLSELERAEWQVQQHLPLVASVESLVLMAGAAQPGSWHVVAELPLKSSWQVPPNPAHGTSLPSCH